MFATHAPRTPPRRHRRWTAAIASASSLVVALALPSMAPAAAQLTPVSASVLAAPDPVEATDGRIHLAYEMTLQNTSGVTLTVDSLAVRTGSGATLRRIGRAEISSVMTKVTREPTSSLASGEGVRVTLDVVLRRGREGPRRLVHRISVVAALPNGESLRFAFDASRTRVGRQPALSVSPPLRGGLYLNFNGCCDLSPHRMALEQMDGRDHLSERFASDFVQIDEDGVGGEGDLTRNESFFTFGEPVLAVGDARVVRTLNGVPENTPLIEPSNDRFTPRTIVGNQVVLRLRGGQFATYGHLQTGSVRVRRGQRVRRGDVLGRVGNTGQSGGPHLHFQLSDGPDPIASNGLPYVFGRFTLAGAVTNVGQFLTGAANADIRPQDGRSRRRGQMPLQNTVVRFPG